MVNDKAGKGYTQIKIFYFSNVIYFILLIIIMKVFHLDMRKAANICSAYISKEGRSAQILDRL